MNLVALQWLRKRDPQLIAIVRTEYATELRSGEQLSALVPRIAPNIESLITRHSMGQVHRVAQESKEDKSEVKAVRQHNWGKKGSERNGGKQGRINRQGDLFCPGCFSISKELKVSIDFKHRPSMCPRSHAVARILQADTEENSEDNEDTVDFEDDGKKSLPEESLLNFSNFQSKSTKMISEGNYHHPNHLVPNFTFHINVNQEKPQISQAVDKDLNILSSTVSDSPNIDNVIIQQVRNLEERKSIWSSSMIRKEASPRVKAAINDAPINPVIDEGSEINCVSEEFLDANKIKFVPTNCSASSADATSMQVVGQTKENVILSIIHNTPVVWDLGKCIVVKNLSVDMLIGEPGKVDNQIVTLPHLRKIKTFDINGKPTIINYSNTSQESRHLCKVTSRKTLQVGESFQYSLPPHLQSKSEVALCSIRDKQSSWVQPRVLRVNDGQIEITNESPIAITLKKNSIFADVVAMNEVSIKEENQVKKVLVKSKDYSHLECPSILKNPASYLDEINIDPNDQLSPTWKKKFKELCEEFSDTINPNPGRYNGYYGDIDNSLDFISTPPPSVRARLPNYSTDKLKIMGELMDNLEEMGVLAKPEDVGVVPAFVVPSLLMPKPGRGEWRLVSDFTPLNIHIRKFQNVAPTIQDAKKIIAKYKYNIECDLSHCFFQGGMRKEDIQYLATPHPYKGLRVYCVEPQGLRNASEHAYERLARIFGDLCMQEKMTRMADGLYIVGDTLQELIDNFTQVLMRARNSNMTFKPKKVVIAPLETVLFGWRKSGDGWKPTEHTISPLTLAEEPTTVKQLRSFIGSFKQLTECIKDYAILMGPLEQVVAGKSSAERIQWTEDLSKSFRRAKESLANVETIFVAKPTDKLDIFTDYSASAKAVGGRLTITRKDEDGSCRQLLGGHYSCKLNIHQKNWLPCEGEALAVRLVAKHFSPAVMENENTTTIHSDNMPTVHAWRRMKTGAFSTSARVAAFLTGLSALRVEVIHKPGKSLLVSDYNSRHPNSCSSKNCKICQFAYNWQKIGNETVPMVCTVSVQDIENGCAKMPFTQRAAWAKVQSDDKVHKMLFKLIETSGVPERKKTTGDYTRLKRLHNLYRNGQLKIETDGLTVITSTDTSGNATKSISVPNNFFPGLVHALHLKLKHPSRAQMQRLVSRYFYCAGHTRIIDEVVSNCDLCQSLQELPRELFTESTSPTPLFGKNFSADVIKKDGQLIFVCREKLSQFTSSKFMPDETADALRDCLVTAVLELMPDEGAVVQVDCAPGLQTLAAECKLDGSILKKLSIFVDMGRTLNKNKNPIAENCIKEFHKERLRLNILPGRLTEIDRAMITKNMNSRVRERGFTAKEMAFNRDQINNNVKPVSDEKLSSEQTRKRVEKHNKPAVSHKPEPFAVGDDVYLKDDKTKMRGREKYKIVKMFSKSDENWAILQKSNLKFMAKEYEVKITEIFPVLKKKVSPESGMVDEDETNSKDVTSYSNVQTEDELIILETVDDDFKDDEEAPVKNTPVTKDSVEIPVTEMKVKTPVRKPSKRKTAIAASKAFKHFKIKKAHCEAIKLTKADNSPLHAWNYSDWLELNEFEDELFVLEPARKPKPRSRISIDLQSRFGLLDLFPPAEEPEPEWDHSPQFLTADNHLTWDESMDVDDKIDQALVQRQLFQASDSVDESLTSSAASDDSTFVDVLQAEARGVPKLRRSSAFRRKRRPVNDEIDDDTSEEPDVTEDQDVNESEEIEALDTTYNVNNLVDQELQLEEEGEAYDEAPEKSDDTPIPDDNEETNFGQDGNRSRRSSRKEINYKYLHTFGHEK